MSDSEYSEMPDGVKEECDQVPDRRADLVFSYDGIVQYMFLKPKKGTELSVVYDSDRDSILMEAEFRMQGENLAEFLGESSMDELEEDTNVLYVSKMVQAFINTTEPDRQTNRTTSH